MLYKHAMIDYFVPSSSDLGPFPHDSLCYIHTIVAVYFLGPKHCARYIAYFLHNPESSVKVDVYKQTPGFIVFMHCLSLSKQIFLKLTDLDAPFLKLLTNTPE